MYVCIYVCMCVYVCIYVCVCMYVCMCMCVCICKEYIKYINVNMYIIYACNVCMYRYCMYVCIYIYIHTRARARAQLYIYVSAICCVAGPNPAVH